MPETNFDHIDADLLEYDILKRHPWFKTCIYDLLQDEHTTLFDFIENQKNMNLVDSSFNLDAILTDYLKAIIFPRKYFEKKHFFKITKTGISALANLTAKDLNAENVPVRSLFDILVVYSIVPASWSQKWNDKKSINNVVVLTHLLNLATVRSEEDFLNLLRPYKGDVTKIFEQQTTVVSIFLREDETRTSYTIAPANNDKPHTFYYGDDNSQQYKATMKINEIRHMESDFSECILMPILTLAHCDEADAAFKSQIIKKIIGAKSLYKLHLKANIWHEHVDRIHRTKESMRNQILNWTALTEDYVGKHNLQIKFLTSSEELIDEGSRSPDKKGVRGLGHCVASYAENASKGYTHIASIRELNDDGSYKRISTAQLNYSSTNKHVRIVQHQAFENTTPFSEAQEALYDFCDKFNKGHLKINDIEIGKENDTEPKQLEVRQQLEILYVLWKPILAKEYKNKNLDDLIQEVKNDFEVEKLKNKPKQLEWSDIFNFFKRMFKITNKPMQITGR